MFLERRELVDGQLVGVDIVEGLAVKSYGEVGRVREAFERVQREVTAHGHVLDGLVDLLH